MKCHVFCITIRSLSNFQSLSQTTYSEINPKRFGMHHSLGDSKPLTLGLHLLTNIRFTVALNHRHGSKRKNDYTKISLETPKVSQQTRSNKTGLQLFNMLSTTHVACRCLFGTHTWFLGRSNVVRYFTSCLFLSLCVFRWKWNR